MGTPQHCQPVSPYLAKISAAFNVCIPTDLALLSVTLGSLSVVAWLFAQIPQIYKNWKLQSASGLSMFFLGEWLLGDLANLAGAIMTKQAAWQICIAIYYVFVDVCLTSQYIWFTHLRHRNKGVVRLEVAGPMQDGNDDETPDTQDLSTKHDTKHRTEHITSVEKVKNTESASSSTPTSGSSSAEATVREKPPPSYRSKSSFLFPNSILALSAAITTVAASPTRSFSTLTTASSPSLNLGRLISWLSTLLYLASRFPQIYKNSVRRSTAGLSPYMFLAAFLGNLLYAAALLANPLAWTSCAPYTTGIKHDQLQGYVGQQCRGWAGPEGSDQREWLELAAPFFLGAAGVLLLDATVGLQFLVYSAKEPLIQAVEAEDVREGVAVAAVPIDIPNGQGQEEEDHGMPRARWGRRVSGWMRGWIPSPSPVSRLVDDGGGNGTPGIDDSETTLLLPGQRARRTNDGHDSYGALS